MSKFVENMEYILEIILTVISELIPDSALDQIEKIRSKGLRIFLIILIIAVFFVCIVGLLCLCNYLIYGYWI